MLQKLVCSDSNNSNNDSIEPEDGRVKRYKYQSVTGRVALTSRFSLRVGIRVSHHPSTRDYPPCRRH